MPKRTVSSSTTCMTTDIPAKTSWPPTIGNPFNKLRQTHKALKTAKLNQIKEKAIHYDVVGIDEGQFFEDIVEFAEDLANRGVVVIVAALDATFQRKPFGNIINLVPLAEKVYKLTAVCVYCAEAAAFTLRTVVSQ